MSVICRMFEGTALRKSWANIANNNSASRKRRGVVRPSEPARRTTYKAPQARPPPVRPPPVEVTGRNARNIELAEQNAANLRLHKARANSYNVIQRLQARMEAQRRSRNRSPPKPGNSPLSRMEKRLQAAAKRRATRARSPPKEGNSPLSRMEKRLQRLRAARAAKGE